MAKFLGSDLRLPLSLWLLSQLTGRGKYTWPDGSQYEGDVQDGLRHGQGVFTAATKERYEGEWKNGLRHGFGILWYNEERTAHYKVRDHIVAEDQTCKMRDRAMLTGGCRPSRVNGKTVRDMDTVCWCTYRVQAMTARGRTIGRTELALCSGRQPMYVVRVAQIRMTVRVVTVGGGCYNRSAIGVNGSMITNTASENMCGWKTGRNVPQLALISR